MPNIIDELHSQNVNILNNQAIILNKLNAIAEAMGKTPTVTLESSAAVVEEQATTTVTPTPPATPDVSASEPETEKQESNELVNDAGIPWHKDYHASTQKQNNDGSWKARKGVDKDALKAYEAQFTATGDTDVPATPPAPSTPATPPPPSTPATPPAPSVSGDLKDETGKLLKTLSIDYKVPYLHIIDAILKKHGASSFDEVPADKVAEVKAEAEAWLAKMEELDGAIETLTNIDDATGKAHNLPQHVLTFIRKAGVETTGDIKHDQLDSVLTDVVGFADQWDAWFKSQQ